MTRAKFRRRFNPSMMHIGKRNGVVRMTKQRINKEHFLCPICGSDSFKVLYSDTLGNELPRYGYNFTPNHSKTYRIVLCQNCEHGYTSPRPKMMWRNYKLINDRVYLGNMKVRIETARKVLATIKRHMPRGRLLDVGCSTGDFLFAAQEVYEVEGLELSTWAAKIAERRGFCIHKHKLEHFKRETIYDVITLWGVIEHFEVPSREVAKIAKLLRKGGIVCLWTGDLMSLPSRLLGRKWWYIQGQHLQLFSPRSLVRLFRNNGFNKVWIGRYPYVMTMKYVAQSLNRYPFIGKLTNLFLNLPLLNECTLTLRLPGEMFAVFRKV